MNKVAYNKQLVTSFIQEVWNGQHFEKIDDYLHPDFTDHSLPATLPRDRNGLEAWIRNTGKAFAHNTVIEQLVADEAQVMVRIRFEVQHIGTWRGLEPAGVAATVKGYRQFAIRDGKIEAQWALIDGEALQAAITEAAHGCALPQPAHQETAH